MSLLQKNSDDRICQGDIFRNVEFIEKIDEADGLLKVHVLTFPYAVVLTQDCDLESYFGRDNIPPEKPGAVSLVSVILAPMYVEQHLRNGKHLSELEMEAEYINSERWGLVKKNENKRYHYFNFDNSEPRLPNLVIDFKHYFGVKVEYLTSGSKAIRVARLADFFREDLSHRFAHFLSRIGLPDLS